MLVDTGRLEEAQVVLDAGGWDGELPTDRVYTVLLGSRSRLRVAQGRMGDAVADSLEAHAIARASRADTNWDGWSRIALLRHAPGEHVEARRESDALLAAARRWDTPGAIGQALRVAGL